MCGEWLSLSRKITASKYKWWRCGGWRGRRVVRKTTSTSSSCKTKRKAACSASLFHSHTPQVVPVKHYYTHRTCHSWSPSVSDAAKCLIMFGIVQERLRFILAKHDNILWRNNIAPENIAVIMFSCFIEMTHPSVLLPTTYELPLHSPFLPVVVCHSAIVFHSAILLCPTAIATSPAIHLSCRNQRKDLPLPLFHLFHRSLADRLELETIVCAMEAYLVFFSFGTPPHYLAL